MWRPPHRTLRCVLAAGLLGAVACRRPTPTVEPVPSAQPPLPPGASALAPSLSASAHPSGPPSPSSAVPVWPTAEVPAPPADRGIFPDLHAQVRLRHPSWLAAGPAVIVSGPGGRFAAIGGVPIALATGTEGPVVEVTNLAASDADGDSLPDALDILIGAKKAVLNGDHYRNTYRVLDYPGGDLPRDEGVCTDVIVRSLRNAGFDLQRLVHEDIVAAPARYPMVERPDRSIDHRRVRTILPYFLSHWRALPTEAAREPFLPGDVVFLDTLPALGPDHLGIVSDTLGPSGLPLLVNNWTDGYRTSEMDLLGWVPITHRFRVPSPPLVAAGPGAGLAGVLDRAGLTVGAETAQVLLVTAPLWTSTQGTLRRYERDGSTWRELGTATVVRLGSSGLGRGRGLHGAALAGVTPKREGDRRAPAGVFALGTAFGPGGAPYGGAWPWRSVGPRDRYVDDPASRFYNTWQLEPEQGVPAWDSAERLDAYSLGLVVAHNPSPAEPGAGSAIFLHPWPDGATPTVGCTSMPRDTLVELLDWLRPAAHPVLVQTAGTVL